MKPSVLIPAEKPVVVVHLDRHTHADDDDDDDDGGDDDDDDDDS